ncbi:NADPH-dependent F420 reductase [Nesterenkonia populi]|uniref:NADPH-dependent F420 reductase n=1 Tax=Nesterenkonia populi TaxID=1591087 RepID=UPI0011BEFA46|nr:NAD(P)-binding domain-containing protein [Nesterenkonia populi]
MSETADAGSRPVVGILGAGRAGTAIARTLLAAGIDVDICSTRPPKALQHHLKIYAPGANPVRPEMIAERTRVSGPGVVVLAVPHEDLDEVDPETTAGTVLIDATNTWHDELLPGWLQAAIDEQLPTSQAIAGHFRRSTVVKALNHISHHELQDAAQPDLPTAQRRALALAADDDQARARAMGLLVRMGFDPVSIGSLAVSGLMDPDGPLFNRPLRREDILRHLA